MTCPVFVLTSFTDCIPFFFLNLEAQVLSSFPCKCQCKCLTFIQAMVNIILVLVLTCNCRSISYPSEKLCHLYCFLDFNRPLSGLRSKVNYFPFHEGLCCALRKYFHCVLQRFISRFLNVLFSPALCMRVVHMFHIKIWSQSMACIDGITFCWRCSLSILVRSKMFF